MIVETSFAFSIAQLNFRRTREKVFKWLTIIFVLEKVKQNQKRRYRNWATLKLNEAIGIVLVDFMNLSYEIKMLNCK